MSSTASAVRVFASRYHFTARPPEGDAWRLAGLLLLVVLSGGCSGFDKAGLVQPQRSITATGSSFPRTHGGLLAYANYLETLNASQLQNELAMARDQREARADAYNQLRLAMLLMQPKAPFIDRSEAAELLREYREQSGSAQNETKAGSRTDGDPYYRELALFLLNNLTRRQQLEQELISVRHKLEQLKQIEQQLMEPDNHRDASGRQ